MSDASCHVTAGQHYFQKGCWFFSSVTGGVCDRPSHGSPILGTVCTLFQVRIVNLDGVRGTVCGLPLRDCNPGSEREASACILDLFACR